MSLDFYNRRRLYPERCANDCCSLTDTGIRYLIACYAKVSWSTNECCLIVFKNTPDARGVVAAACQLPLDHTRVLSTAPASLSTSCLHIYVMLSTCYVMVCLCMCKRLRTCNIGQSDRHVLSDQSGCPGKGYLRQSQTTTNQVGVLSSARLQH